VLLQKTLLNIEGLGRQLYPELDLWTTAKPFMERWMKERVGVLGLLRRSRKNLIAVADQIPELPLVANRLLNELEHRQIAGGGLLARDQSQGPCGRPEPSVAIKALGGATVALCGTLVLVLGPGPWLGDDLALALVGACYLGGAWLFVSAGR
jgi:ubiquinone biosynthesis protein